MKRFLIHATISILFILGVLYVVAYQAGTNVDLTYQKVIGKREKSLIIGSSRASNGIVPSLIDSAIGVKIFNFGFTLPISPFGPSYLRAIKAKVEEGNYDENRLFIVEVSPLTVSDYGVMEKDVLSFSEDTVLLGKVSKFTGRPNWGYLMDFYNERWINLLLAHEKEGRIYDDGWVGLYQLDSITQQSRYKGTLNYISEHLHRVSDCRLEYLKKTILYLQQYGNVVMIRMPIEAEVYRLEQKNAELFDIKMLLLSDSLDIVYFDFTSIGEDFRYLDGQHMPINQAQRFTKILMDSIKKMDGKSPSILRTYEYADPS